MAARSGGGEDDRQPDCVLSTPDRGRSQGAEPRERVDPGTVARTERIPIERRAEAAVIAWMRHRTTASDSLAIPRVRGKRREVRRVLAERSRELLGRYRRGETPATDCPLALALAPGDRSRSA